MFFPRDMFLGAEMSYYNNIGNMSVAGVQIMELQTVHSCTRVAHNITFLSRDLIRIPPISARLLNKRR